MKTIQTLMNFLISGTTVKMPTKLLELPVTVTKELAVPKPAPKVKAVKKQSKQSRIEFADKLVLVKSKPVLLKRKDVIERLNLALQDFNDSYLVITGTKPTVIQNIQLFQRFFRNLNLVERQFLNGYAFYTRDNLQEFKSGFTSGIKIHCLSCNNVLNPELQEILKKLFVKNGLTPYIDAGELIAGTSKISRHHRK